MGKIRDGLINILSDSDRWLSWTWTALRIVLIFVAARIAIRMITKALKHMAADNNRIRLNPRRTTTIIQLMNNVVKYVINFVMILMILNQLGVPIGPMLAGAGVVGLAIGFGAQSLVKDVITGFFIIFEDQFAIGDVVQIGSYKGTVEEIGLRVTRLKNWTGEVYIIPNGSIAQVTNFTLNNSLAVIDLSLNYETDVDQALGIIRSTVTEAARNADWMISNPDVLGIQTISGGSIVIRIACECKPNSQLEAVRILNAEMKKALDAHGIKISSSIQVS